MKLKSSKLILILALIFIVLGIIGYFALKENPKIQFCSQTILATVSKIINPNSNTKWKTYTNNKFKFEISYPNDWRIIKSTDNVMWYKNDSQSQLDPKILRMGWYDPAIMYKIGIRCDKNKTCQEIERITTPDKSTIISIWKPTNEDKSHIGSEYLGFIENSEQEVTPEFSTDFDDIQIFKEVLQTFKFIR